MLQSKKMRYFLAAAEHLHFSAAAESLSISQPALSRSMRQLEEHIGEQLFERGAKGVVLTRCGKILQRRARLMELEAKYTLDEIKANKMGSGGVLNVGAGPAWLRVILPPAILELQYEHPKLQLNLVTGVVETHLTSLMSGKIDLLCGDLDFPHHPELISVHLTDFEFVIVASKKHPLTKQANIAAADLLAYQWITLKGDYLGKNRFNTFFSAQGLSPPDISIFVSPGVSIFGILEDSDYLACIPKQFVEIAYRTGCLNLNIRPLWAASHGMVYRKKSVPEQVISSLVSILKKQFQDDVGVIKKID